MSASHLITFVNTYSHLPNNFYYRISPIKVRNPTLIAFNKALANDLGLDLALCDTQTLANIFSGNTVLEGSEPLAMAYAGHQFGNFVPVLGDGRALLLGEVIDQNGKQRDIHLKGSGRTPFSRRGDGRAAIGPIIREYIISEAMHRMGIPTTRSLAAVATGETVYRDRELPGAILTRVANSHVRIGTFQYFHALNDHTAIKTLADYVIQRLYPEAQQSNNPYQFFLNKVIENQASLIAAWMHIGFIHGVMNTDNMAISGETIDYGPCAFLDEYIPNQVFSSIDLDGRYSFNNQPAIALWNLTRFAETLLSLLDRDTKKAIHMAEESLHSFQTSFEKCWLSGMKMKLGLTIDEKEDFDLMKSLLNVMHSEQLDYTNTFRMLVKLTSNPTVTHSQPLSNQFHSWIDQWLLRLRREPFSLLEISVSMAKVNPVYIPRNHRLQQVIVSAENGDYAPMKELEAVLQKPFIVQEQYQAYENPPLAHERIKETFCGT